MGCFFGENLRRLIKEKNMNVSQVSKCLGIPPATLAEYLHNDNRIPRDAHILRALADFFGVSISYLLFSEEDKNTNLPSLLAHKVEILSGTYEISIKKIINKDGSL